MFLIKGANGKTTLHLVVLFRLEYFLSKVQSNVWNVRNWKIDMATCSMTITHDFSSLRYVLEVITLVSATTQ